MTTVSTENWVKFFTKAGIPQRAAATYAFTFADNRIQLDMLLDLNKEYLRDMGITLMGDVIAILRHAREVHEEITHQKLLSSAKVPNKTLKPVASVRESANNSAAKLVKKVVKVPSKSSSSSSYDSSSSSSQSSASLSPPKKVSVPSRISDPKQRPAVTGRPSGSTHSLASTSDKITVKKPEPESLKRRSGEISRIKPSGEKVEPEEILVPVKKARRVLPEHEGGYKIKMPSGSTPRSQEILAKQKEIASKKTVFDRLGRSSSPSADPLTAAVSSTTSDPSFTVTGIEGAKKAKITSVFSRLGDKQVTSTSAVPIVEATPPYAGILKNKVTKNVSKPPAFVQRTSSMVADSLSSTNRSDVQSRIGASKDVTVVKRSATLMTTPKKVFPVERIATVVSVPKQVPSVKRTATIVSVPKPAKLVKTEGILAGHSDNAIRPVKSRLGSEEIPRTPQVQRIAKATIPLVSQRLQLPRANGNPPSISTKRVTFGSTLGKVSSRSNVFSRLGT